MRKIEILNQIQDSLLTNQDEATKILMEGSETADTTEGGSKPGLWDNIRKKKEREGKKYRPAKKGDKDRPDPDAWKKAQSEYEEGQMQREQLMKMHHQLMEISEYLDGVVFEDWTNDMISKAEIYIQNIYDFVEARKSDG
jgi:hypothetical protein